VGYPLAVHDAYQWRLPESHPLPDRLLVGATRTPSPSQLRRSLNPFHPRIGAGFRNSRVQEDSKLPSGGGVTSGSVSVPKSVPLADIAGTTDGTTFAFNVSIGLSGGSSGGARGAIGSVTGTFHGGRIDVMLSAKGSSEYTNFDGTIGGDKINGTIDPIRQHGRTSTAHATFDVTR
jgi:hypothetical protein